MSQKRSWKLQDNRVLRFTRNKDTVRRDMQTDIFHAGNRIEHFPVSQVNKRIPAGARPLPRHGIATRFRRDDADAGVADDVVVPASNLHGLCRRKTERQPSFAFLNFFVHFLSPFA